MTKYRDLLCEDFGTEIGSVVGCGLDRIGQDVSGHEIDAAVSFYNSWKNQIDTYPIGARRQAVAEFITGGMLVPEYIRNVSV